MFGPLGELRILILDNSYEASRTEDKQIIFLGKLQEPYG